MQKRLNIGCGRDYREGWINYDISSECNPDMVLDIRLHQLYDLDKKLIPKDTVDEIYISGVLEQIGENEHLIHAMNECHRVLKPGGKMIVVVPNAKYAIAHQDPMDVRKFTAETFPYFEKGTRHHDLYGSVYGFNGWSKIRIEENARHIFTVEFIK